VSFAQDAEDPLRFDYFRNNWNVIGLKDYERASRITPGNEMLLSGGTAIRVALGPDSRPLTREQGKRPMDGWLPIMVCQATHGSVRYEITYWATPLPDARDWRAAFAWPAEGENFLCWIQVQATNEGDEPQDARAAIGPADPGAGARSFVWEWELAPGEHQAAVARYPFFPIDNPSIYDGEDQGLWLDRTAEYWRREVLQGRARIGVPCEKATNALLAAHVCQLIASDHGDLRGGEDFYDEFYIRDGAYQVMELEEAGLFDAARQAVSLYLDRQRPDGRFESQPGQFDANGQALWVLWQYYRMTTDDRWLAEVYPAMRKAVDWTMDARRQAPPDSPFAGLLPNALADGEYLWGGEHHIVGYDLWNLRGVLCTADAAEALGKGQEAQALREEAELYRQAIDTAWRETGLDYFPPSWEGAGTHWGNTETLWPTPLFDTNDPRVGALIDHVRHDFADGFVEGTIRWTGLPGVIHPYLSAYTTMADLARGNHEQVVEDFYWYLLHSTEAHAFPEGVYYERRYAWNETIPHVTGACNFAIMLRHMLVHEQGDELHLLRAVPDWWLDEGQEIRIERLPTYFGEMDLTVRGVQDGVEVELTPPTRRPPERMVFHLPQSRPLQERVGGMEVKLRSDQTTRWDFDAVVSLYLRSDPPPVWVPPEVPSLTTGRPVSCSTSLPGHPAHLANDGYRGDADRYWAMDVRSGHEAWWQVDLEAPVEVSRVVVVCFYGDTRHYGFTVETSLDGEEWQLVADRRDNEEPATEEGYVCDFAPRQVRYIRVTQTSNSANTGRHLVEVMAYGPD
jgi:hypothetical protein